VKFNEVTALEKKQYMIKKTFFYITFAGIVILFASGFKRYEFKHIKGFHIEQDSIYYSTVPNFAEISKENNLKIIEIPETSPSFISFKEKLGQKESRGRYNVINRFGYMGKYQFGKSTLRVIGIKDTEAFLHNPKLQEKSFEALLSINKYMLRNEINKYVNQTINGVKITESGILAAAHLGGAGSIQKFLNSNGSHEFKDGNGTSVKTYLKMFANYDTSNIIAKRSVNLSHLETKKVETSSFDNQNIVEIEQVKRDDTKESNAIDDLN
jgi:hypothetical protein